jgi:general secretion pathway protein D
MRRLFRPAAACLCILAMFLSAAGESARTLYKKGQDAEARQKYEAAYEFYKGAWDEKPKDLRYRAAAERMRILAASSMVHKAQILRDAGNLNEALALFQKAADTDPTLAIAQQEAKRTKAMIDAGQAGKPQSEVGPPPSAIRQRLESAMGPVELNSIANVPITLKMTEDTKVVYETVGKLAGINVLFDPDYTSRKVHIELNSVTLEEALQIISLESKTFWRPVTPNTVFVAADNPAKRKEIEQNVIKTFYLSNVSTATELQDLVNALRTVLEIPRIQQLPSQNAIIIRGTPDQLALAQKMIDDIDKARPEVVVEVAVMQVSRDKIKNYGVNPPTSTSVSLIPNVNTSSTTGSTTGSSSNGAFNLNTLRNLNATNFQVTIPGASLTALFSDGDTKVIQSPQIRALDGQKASLKIGDRVPVATGSFQPGIGGVGINPLVNTQFQYLDVGVNIDLTPHVHANREVSLKISLDVSSVTGTTNIGGISQPTIGQRKIENEIRLKEGEANMMGGIFENSDIKSLSGLPGLAQIPFFKYLFSTTNTEHRENEIVFVLIPHIIRGQDVSEMNDRAIDIGTGTSIGLRRKAPVASVSAPIGALQGNATVAQATAPAQVIPQPAAATQATPQAAAGTTAFMFDPPTVTAAPGGTFTLNVNLTGGQNIYAVPVQVAYDPRFLQVVNVSNGGFLSQDGQAVAVVHRDDAQAGRLQLSATRPPGVQGISGQGAVFTLTFAAKGAGRSMVTITQGGAKNPAMQSIVVMPAQAAVAVQ